MRMIVAVVVGAAVALLAAPAAAQMSPPTVNLLADQPGKTAEEKEADAVRDKAYRESLKKIPDAKASNDPWGNVRSDNAAKPEAKTPAKKTKTGASN